MAENVKAPGADDNKIDHYIRLSLIANGKHAQVWEVQEENTNNRFAMKLLLPEAMQEPEQVSSLKYEGKVAQSLDHPNLIKWIATVQRKTNIYLVLELFRSLNLKTYITNDPVGVQSRLRKLVECVCQGLQHMHEKGWAHLDVKPDNILLSRSSEVKIIDFSLSAKIKGGLGKLLGGGGKNAGGTLTYIAPETVRKEASTAQTDIYSFGITLFECLTGTTPFKGSTPKDLLMKHLSAIPTPPSAFNQNVTPEMDRMVLRMLSKKPKDRQKNMNEVFSEFRNIQAFKEDPEKLQEDRAKDAKEKEKQASLGKRLDSRTDAVRQEAIKANPELAKQIVSASSPPPPPKAATPPPEAKPAPKPAPPPPRPAMPPMPQPMAPGFPPQMPFGMPAMPMPGQFAPMPGYPGMPMAMPGYPPGAGGMMPGMVPMQPAAMMPGAMPGMPLAVPPQMQPPSAWPAMPGQPATNPQQPDPAPATTAPAAGRAKPAGVLLPRGLQRPAPPPTAKDAADLPTMDELPDVL